MKVPHSVKIEEKIDGFVYRQTKGDALFQCDNLTARKHSACRSLKRPIMFFIVVLNYCMGFLIKSGVPIRWRHNVFI